MFSTVGTNNWTAFLPGFWQSAVWGRFLTGVERKVRHWKQQIVHNEYQTSNHFHLYPNISAQRNKNNLKTMQKKNITTNNNCSNKVCRPKFTSTNQNLIASTKHRWDRAPTTKIKTTLISSIQSANLFFVPNSFLFFSK